WDAATGRPLERAFPYRGIVNTAAFGPDGETLLTGSFDGTGRLWDAATGRALGEPLRHQDQVWGVAFSPDGKTLLTGSRDGTALRGSGTRPPAGLSEGHSDIGPGSGAWRSAPMARPSSPAAPTGRRGSGTPPQAGPRPNPSAIMAESRAWPSALTARPS